MKNSNANSSSAFTKAKNKITGGLKRVGKGFENSFRNFTGTMHVAFTDTRNPWFVFKMLIKGLLRTVFNLLRSVTDGLIDFVFGLNGLLFSVFGRKVGGWWMDNLSETVRHIRDIPLELAVSPVHGVLDFVFGFLEGLVFFLTGKLKKAGRRLLRALSNLLSLVLEVVLLVVFKIIFAIQVLFFLEDAGDYLVNVLTSDQRKAMVKLFGHSLNLDLVRYKTGNAGILSFWLARPTQATTILNTLYLRDSMTLKDPDTGEKSFKLKFSLTLHELTHVWQFQNGGSSYLTAAIFEHFSKGGHNKYYWQKHIKELSWEELGVEQQGEFIQQTTNAGAFDLQSPCFLCVERLPLGFSGTMEFMNGYLADAVGKIRRGLGAN